MPPGAARWGLVVLWMATIFGLSSLPRLGAAGRIPDWITHGTAYAAGAFLICRALAGGGPASRGVLAGAVLMATAYGISDEYHQSFVPGRDSDPLDVVKDFAGATVATIVHARRYRREPRP